jgi:hypothetical protein
MDEATRQRIAAAVADGSILQMVQDAVDGLAHGDLPPVSLGELAVLLKREGLLELAHFVLSRHCERSRDPGEARVRAVWRRELDESAWPLARHDAGRTSAAGGDSARAIHLGARWRLRWPARKDQPDRTVDTPAPVVARDLVVVADSTLQRFVGIGLSCERTGREVWGSDIVAERLDYAASPVYVRQTLYFVVSPSIKRLALCAGVASAEQIVSAKEVEPVRFCAPLAWQEKLVCPFRNHVAVVDLACQEPAFLRVTSFTGAAPRSAVVCDGRIYVTTSRGEVFELVDGPSLEQVAELDEGAKRTFSAAAAVGPLLVFEAVDGRGRRRATAFKPATGERWSADLANESCDPDHTHLHFPPVCFGGAQWLAFSDTGPRLYLLSQEADRLSIVGVTLDAAQPISLAQEFSSVAGSTLLSKSSRGLVCVDLRTRALREEVFQPQITEMCAQPVVYGKYFVFACTDGVVCYDATL